MIRKNVNKNIIVFPNTEIFSQEFVQEITITGGTGGEVFRGDSVNNILLRGSGVNEISGLSMSTKGEFNLDTAIKIESINIQGVSFAERPTEMRAGTYLAGNSGDVCITPGHFLGSRDLTTSNFNWYTAVQFGNVELYQPYLSENPSVGLTFMGNHFKSQYTLFDGTRYSPWAAGLGSDGSTNDVWKSFFEILYHPSYNKIIYVPVFIEQRTRLSDLTFNYPNSNVFVGNQFCYPGGSDPAGAGVAGGVILSQEELQACNRVMAGIDPPSSDCPWCNATREDWAKSDGTGGYVRTDHPAFVNIAPYTKTKELRFSSAIYNMDYANVRPTTKIADLCSTDNLFPPKYGLERPSSMFKWLAGISGERIRVVESDGKPTLRRSTSGTIPRFGKYAKQTAKITWPTTELDLSRGWYWVAFLHGATGGPTYGDPLTAATASFGVHKGVFGDQIDPAGWDGWYNNSHTDPNILGIDYKAFTQKRKFNLHPDNVSLGQNSGFTNDHEFFYGVSVLGLGATYSYSETLPDHAGVSFSNEYRYPEFEIFGRPFDGTQSQDISTQSENYNERIDRYYPRGYQYAGFGITGFSPYPQSTLESINHLSSLFVSRSNDSFRDFPLLRSQREKMQQYLGSEFHHPTGVTNLCIKAPVQELIIGNTFNSGNYSVSDVDAQLFYGLSSGFVSSMPVGGDILETNIYDEDLEVAETWPPYLPNYYTGTASYRLFEKDLEDKGFNP